MKLKLWNLTSPPHLLAVLLCLGTTAAQAAPPALNGSVAPRPLTPQEIKDYSLTGKQGASGLNTVGVGQPVYLDAIGNIAIASTNFTVTWALTNQPIGSTATLKASPLGTNVPIYKIEDRTTLQIAGTNGRAMLVPDAVGQYTVTVTISANGSGSTNLVQKIVAANYLGANSCALCHSGGLVASNTYSPWQQTRHAVAFTEKIDGIGAPTFGKNCVSCHVTGYDANTNAVNGGFDDVATQVGWTFPTVITNGNWAAMPSALKNLANIQCESCHGPGSEHAYNLGDTNRISKSLSAGDCAQCHDSLSHHYKVQEWNHSGHAAPTRTPSGPSRSACVRCHTAGGFVDYVNHLGSTNTYTTNTVYGGLTCATCHDPHDASKPNQLRLGENFTMGDGTIVTNAGAGGFCFNCHSSRNGNVTNSIVKYPLGQQTWGGGSAFGVHDSPQADMLEGVNAWTYGKVIPSAAHRHSVTNTCVGCHMQEVASTDPGFTKVGGHTFTMTYSAISGGITNTVEQVEVCVKCHGEMESFDMVKSDYNGDGIIEGVQTEVKHLLDRLSTLMPNSTYRADGNYVADGLVKTSISSKTNWPAKYLQAGYNWQFVNADGSRGVHNTPYAVGLLKASIADLIDDADNDGLSDKWEIAKFGSITVTDGKGDADLDGVSDALEMSAGTNPFAVDSDGDGYSDQAELTAGSDPMNVSDTPGFIVKMHSAAELEFATEPGKNYQIQAVSELSGLWQNIGPQIAGNGNLTNYLVSTRTNVQSFFRVKSF